MPHVERWNRDNDRDEEERVSKHATYWICDRPISEINNASSCEQRCAVAFSGRKEMLQEPKHTTENNETDDKTEDVFQHGSDLSACPSRKFRAGYLDRFLPGRETLGGL